MRSACYAEGRIPLAGPAGIVKDGDTQAVSVAEGVSKEALPGVWAVAVGGAAVGETLSHPGESRDRLSNSRKSSAPG